MNIRAIVLGAFVAIPVSSATGGVVVHSSAADETAGVFISCANPDSVIMITNRGPHTLVAGFGPDEKWEVKLPANKLKYRENYVALDGEAAIVRSSEDPGDSYLVTRRGAVAIDGGHVSIVDFSDDRVLIARNFIGNEGIVAETRIAIFDVTSGTKLGDHVVRGEIKRTVDRHLDARLSGDGKVFYYIAENAAGESRVVIRDAASGVEVKGQADLLSHGEILDLMLTSAAHGYLATTEGLFELRDSGLREIALPRDIGRVTKIVPLNERRYGFVASDGWAVRDFVVQDWLASGLGMGFDIRPAEGGWVLMNRSVTHPVLELHSVAAGTPKVTRRLRQVNHLRQGELVCANGYGVMRYHRGDFDWVPSEPSR